MPRWQLNKNEIHFIMTARNRPCVIIVYNLHFVHRYCKQFDIYAQICTQFCPANRIFLQPGYSYTQDCPAHRIIFPTGLPCTQDYLAHSIIPHTGHPTHRIILCTYRIVLHTGRWQRRRSINQFLRLLDFLWSKTCLLKTEVWTKAHAIFLLNAFWPKYFCIL